MNFLRRITPGSKLANSLTLQEKLVSVRKTTKVTKGGRMFTFSIFVVVGDGNGRFGYGKGKSKEASLARKKAFNSAKKNLYSVAIRGGRTVSHIVEGSCGSSNVLIRPATPGTGVIAGGAAKSFLEIIGFKDIVCKSSGSSANRIAVVLAVANALSKLCSLTTIAKVRGKTTAEVLRKPERKSVEQDDNKKAS